MIRHIWSVICTKSVIDIDTNTLSMFDMVEGITVGIGNDAPERKEGNPIVVPINYEAVSYWTRDVYNKTEYVNIALEILNPKDKVINKMENKMEFKQGLRRMRSRIKMFGLGVVLQGLYKVIIKADSKIVAELPIEVNFVKNPPPQNNPIKN